MIDVTWVSWSVCILFDSGGLPHGHRRDPGQRRWQHTHGDGWRQRQAGRHHLLHRYQPAEGTQRKHGSHVSAEERNEWVLSSREHWASCWLSKSSGFWGYFETRVPDVNHVRMMPWERRLPQRADLEHYCLVLKLSSNKAPLFSIFSAIWASARGAKGENFVHILIRIWKGCTMLTIFFKKWMENILDILFKFTIKQEEQNISPSYTRMAASHFRFSEKWTSNLTPTDPSMFSCFKLRTGTVSRPYWIIPTRCTSNLNPACTQSSCQRHRWVRNASKIFAIFKLEKLQSLYPVMILTGAYFIAGVICYVIF